MGVLTQSSSMVAILLIAMAVLSVKELTSQMERYASYRIARRLTEESAKVAFRDLRHTKLLLFEAQVRKIRNDTL